MLDAVEYLEKVATWFSQTFSLIYSFLERMGFLNVVVACIFAMAVFRLVIYPLIGGASFNLGMDKADPPDKRIESVTYTKNKDGTRTGVYKYRNDK